MRIALLLLAFLICSFITIILKPVRHHRIRGLSLVQILYPFIQCICTICWLRKSLHHINGYSDQLLLSIHPMYLYNMLVKEIFASHKWIFRSATFIHLSCVFVQYAGLKESLHQINGYSDQGCFHKLQFSHINRDCLAHLLQ